MADDTKKNDSKPDEKAKADAEAKAKAAAAEKKAKRSPKSDTAKPRTRAELRAAAKGTATKVEGPRVRARTIPTEGKPLREKYIRGGKKWGSKWTVHPLSAFTEQQLAAMQADPLLEVELKD